MRYMRQINLRVSEELLARVDRARSSTAGLVPREAWIRDAIEMALRLSEQADALAHEEPEQAQRRSVARVMASPPAEQPRRHLPGCKCPVCS